MIQTDLFGHTTAKLDSLKTKVYQLLDNSQSLAHHSRLNDVVYIMAREVQRDISETYEEITMKKVTFEWAIKHAPQIERIIRQYNQDHRAT
jgi:Mor family transcriptional regulator